MKIVFYEIEDWEKDYIRSRIKKAKLEFYSGLLTGKNAEKAKDADIISIFINSKIDNNVLSKLKKVKMITTRSTGYDHINLEECRKRKITVCYVPTYGENTVAEHTFGLILTLSRKLYKSIEVTKNGSFSFQGLQGFDLKGKTIGVIGTGNIGKHVIRIAKGFEMNVVAFDVKKDKKLARQLGFRYIGFKDLLKNSDIVTLHVPYNRHTHHMININNIKLFRKGSLLINTARGSLIQTDALLYALDRGILSGIGLDVLEDENMIKEERELLGKNLIARDLKVMLENHILNEQENVVITPHNAFNSREAIERILLTTTHNINSFLKHKKVNSIR